MKYAILFAFAAFAFLAHAQANTELGLSENQDSGAITEYLEAKLAATKQKLEDMLSKAQDALKKKIDAAKKKVEHLIELLKHKAVQIKKQILEAADKILIKLEAAVAESIPKESLKIESISECMIMKDNFRQAVRSVIANTSSCIDDRIKEANLHAQDIYNITTIAVGAIEDVKKQGEECIRDVNGIEEIAAAIRCVAKVSAKGTVVVGKTVSATMLEVTKLMKEMATLPVRLSFCVPTKALMTLAQQVQPVVVGIKDCIQAKIEESKTPEESSVEQITEEAFQTEIPEEENIEVQSNFGYEAPAESRPMTVQM